MLKPCKFTFCVLKHKKKKLRGAIKYFNGEMNNIPVEVKEGEEILKCGAVYLTEPILEVFKNIVGEENIELKEI